MSIICSFYFITWFIYTSIIQSCIPETSSNSLTLSLWFICWTRTSSCATTNPSNSTWAQINITFIMSVVISWYSCSRTCLFNTHTCICNNTSYPNTNSFSCSNTSIWGCWCSTCCSNCNTSSWCSNRIASTSWNISITIWISVSWSWFICTWFSFTSCSTCIRSTRCIICLTFSEI